MMSVASCTPIPFSIPWDDWLPCFFVTPVGFMCIITRLFTCLCMCHPFFNTMRLWTSDPNLHLSFVDTTFCLLSCLFTFACCFLSCLSALLIVFCLHPVWYACRCYLACLFCTLLLLSMHLSLSIARLLVPCLCLCMYTHGARTHGARARSPRCKQKGRGCKLANMSRAAIFSRFRV